MITAVNLAQSQYILPQQQKRKLPYSQLQKPVNFTGIAEKVPKVIDTIIKVVVSAGLGLSSFSVMTYFLQNLKKNDNAGMAAGVGLFLGLGFVIFQILRDAKRDSKE